MDGYSVFITNLSDGIDHYRLPDFQKVQSFPHAIKLNLTLQIAVANGGSIIVCGGDDGFARAFDRRTGRLLQCLDHGNGV